MARPFFKNNGKIPKNRVKGNDSAESMAGKGSPNSRHNLVLDYYTCRSLKYK
jgi:hypothetical protein